MKFPKENISILIPDGEHPLSIRVVQCLSEVKDVKIFILAANKYASIRFSRHVTKFIYYEKSDGLEDWLSNLNYLVRKYNIDVIMPVFQDTIKGFIANKSLLEGVDKMLIPSSLEQFNNAKNKWYLHKQLEELGIPSPRSCDVDDPEFEPERISHMDFPVLIKPKYEMVGSGKGIIRFNTRKELETYLEQNNSISQVMLQEYFPGLDLGCNVICRNGDILAYTVQLGTLFEENEFAPQIGLKMIYEENVRFAVTRLMKALQWTGVAHIDFHYNPESKKFVVLEINPRYWHTLLASTFSGVNFPWLYCQTVLGRSFEMPGYKKIEYLELKGLYKKVLDNPLYLLKFRTIWRVSPIKYFIKDPVMAVNQLILGLKIRLFN